MIKNQKQASVTKKRLNELISDRDRFIGNEKNISSAKSRLTLNGYNGLIQDLQLQLNQFEGLSKGTLIGLNAATIHTFHETLIAARIAQNISQKELGERLGIKEQQIQRYEASDYEGASYTRVRQIALALGVNCRLEKTWLENPSVDWKKT